MATAEEAEVVAEVEAMQAVYGDDCVVMDSYPPHLHVHIKPRTADVTSQQFVEALLGNTRSSQYPMEPPHIDLIDSKGLDEQRQKDLVTCIRDKACELSSYLMLVALCEEAVEKLTIMNHPDGDCPLCLYPLVPEDGQNGNLPFMKLMSCFHCFHSECIIRWWNWLHTEKETNASDSASAIVCPIHYMDNRRDPHGAMGENMGICPVCRKVFHSKDIDHVLCLVGSHSSQLNADDTEVDHSERLLKSDSENIRRQKFETIQRLQQNNGGLIEPKRDLVVLPGMFLPQPAASAATMSAKESSEQQQTDPPVNLETHSGESSTRATTSAQRRTGMRKHRGGNSRKQVKQTAALPTMSTKDTAEQQRSDPTGTSETRSMVSADRPSTSEHRISDLRKHRHRNTRKPVKQWIRKDDATAE
ncbi:uncharacterized protein LOC121241623 isoform X1 [Juglans microcarpa x Juglans regia]|uniref:uncharacterized protein LOC121241623 isoform X1 n=1 Tax=Juglans microcarpa x Juglans regia TaxID=2249226 RepID=UPI001B7DF79C|nr:uncharacterized protein LOC121241623 isoform X1 [Juglans microcarpa x Juglans regia]